ncbi:hypothetical protein LY78DRAFT_97209 [Colletotrichum sublineola]|nr:hypothetical protein LY78DRAFT_97209 [Colletotrichum sublineola]
MMRPRRVASQWKGGEMRRLGASTSLDQTQAAFPSGTRNSQNTKLEAYPHADHTLARVRLTFPRAHADGMGMYMLARPSTPYCWKADGPLSCELLHTRSPRQVKASESVQHHRQAVDQGWVGSPESSRREAMVECTGQAVSTSGHFTHTIKHISSCRVFFRFLFLRGHAKYMHMHSHSHQWKWLGRAKRDTRGLDERRTASRSVN